MPHYPASRGYFFAVFYGVRKVVFAILISMKLMQI